VEKASNPQHWLNPLSAANIAWQLRESLISVKVCETMLIKDAYEHDGQRLVAAMTGRSSEAT
jgi:hypothetical protein